MVPTADGRNASYPFANLVPQDGSGKAFERTPDQVLPPVHRLLCMRIVSVFCVDVLQTECVMHACCCSSAHLGTATHSHATAYAAGINAMHAHAADQMCSCLCRPRREAARRPCACYMAKIPGKCQSWTWYMQVLAIVYGGNSTQPGAFYPKGMTGNVNGTIATS